MLVFKYWQRQLLQVILALDLLGVDGFFYRSTKLQTQHATLVTYSSTLCNRPALYVVPSWKVLSDIWPIRFPSASRPIRCCSSQRKKSQTHGERVCCCWLRIQWLPDIVEPVWWRYLHITDGQTDWGATLGRIIIMKQQSMAVFRKW